MPLSRFAADAFSVVTICLVAILLLLGFVCIAYSFYFRSRIHHDQFSYFSGPWIMRIAFILIAIWWGLGEIIRLSLLRRGFHLQWQWQEESMCKWYIVSNLGFAEPCLFLTLVFLLRAPLHLQTGGIIVNTKWNVKTAGYILLYCLPFFVLQLFVIFVGGGKFKTSSSSSCTYPLFSTLLLGLFALILTSYLFWLGSRILKLVINKGLQKRVYTLVLSVSGFLPLRVVFLGLSVLSGPEDFMFEAFAFLAFLALLCCAGVCMCMLVYRPLADCLALHVNDTMSLIEENASTKYSDACHFSSTKLLLSHSILITPYSNLIFFFLFFF